ncbi:MAG: hypothetical protein ACKOW5_12435, partial [Actinomycetales bacterium]
GPTTATVRVAAGQAAELRRLAISSDDDLLQIQTLSRERLVSVVCAAGDAVAVQQPMHVRQEVTLALARIVERHAVPQ